MPEANARSLTLRKLNGTFAVCRFSPDAELPSWVTGTPWFSITRTDAELSIVCSQQAVPDDVRCERDFIGFGVVGPLAFDMVGVLASLTHALAVRRVPVFVVSTHDTDYLFVRRNEEDVARTALTAAGYRVD